MPAAKTPSGPFYAEIIYEDGTSGIGYYESVDEMATALKAHHEKARNGEPAGPAGRDDPNLHAPAVRIKRALWYKEHPATYREDQTMTADEFLEHAKDAAERAKDKNGVLFLPEALSHMRDTTASLKSEGEMTSRHDSKLRAAEDGEFASSLWTDGSDD